MTATTFDFQHSMLCRRFTINLSWPQLLILEEFADRLLASGFDTEAAKLQALAQDHTYGLPVAESHALAWLEHLHTLADTEVCAVLQQICDMHGLEHTLGDSR